MSVGAATLEVRGLTKDFGRLRAVDDVSFAIRPGTIRWIRKGRSR